MNFYDENSTYELMGNFEDELGDILYLKELYPSSLLELQRLVDDECDRMEYDGSIMFDEYPDKERLLALEKNVFENAKKMYDNKLAGWQDKRGVLPDEWLYDIIGALLINEMMRRRSRRRISRRGFC